MNAHHVENDPDLAHDHSDRLDWRAIARVGFVAIVAAGVWLGVWDPWPRLSVLGLIGAVAGGWPIFHEAWQNLRERRMTMELSMTIALAAALVIGEYFTALVITAFVLAAEILEGMTVGRGRRAIRDLLDFLPALVTVRRATGTIRIDLDDVQAGDTLLIAPGERIAVDGHVVSGRSYVDQSAITGESSPVAKDVGSTVFAGTVNQAGALDVIAERLGKDTSFGKIVEAVETAERSRAPVQKVADRYAALLVYFALGCAALTFAVTRDARSTISVIIVAGACGIAAGTPLAILGAIGRAARGGAIIKGGRYLEALWTVGTVAFDKTGTVTFGSPQVRSVRAVAGTTAGAVLEAAAIAERRSEHPIAAAILRDADAQRLSRIDPELFTYFPGRGIVARSADAEIVVGNRALMTARGISIAGFAPTDDVGGVSEVYVASRGVLLGVVEVADTPRAEAVRAVQALRALGIRTVLLTGDNHRVARAIGRELDFDEVQAELLPEDKVAAVRRLGAGNGVVAMVGDGVNDAPALVEAAVGVAMGSGTDVARESADIVLLGNDLSTFVETVRLARRT